MAECAFPDCSNPRVRDRKACRKCINRVAQHERNARRRPADMQRDISLDVAPDVLDELAFRQWWQNR